MTELPGADPSTPKPDDDEDSPASSTPVATPGAAEAATGKKGNRKRWGFIAAPLAALVGVVGLGIHRSGGESTSANNQSAPAAAVTPETVPNSTPLTTEAPKTPDTTAPDTTTTTPTSAPGETFAGSSLMQPAGQPEQAPVPEAPVTTTTAISHQEISSGGPVDAINPNANPAPPTTDPNIVGGNNDPNTNMPNPGDVITQGK